MREKGQGGLPGFLFVNLVTSVAKEVIIKRVGVRAGRFAGYCSLFE